MVLGGVWSQVALERRAYTEPLRQSGVVRGAQRQAATSRQVAAVSIEALGVSPGGAAAGADLG